jgi:class 3 adenylate cyclase
VQRGLAAEVLLALLEAPPEGVEGGRLQARLQELGRRARSDELLTALLRLEAIDQVRVDRSDRYRFALTDAGRERAIETGGGQPVHVRLLMLDLVDFTAYTAEHGDAAAHDAARTLAGSARAAIDGAGGAVVKELGDGVLAWLPPDRAALPVAREIAGGCRRPDGDSWPLRAASHVGRPIRSRGDLFGGDVNLVARLCDLAAPDELVTTLDGQPPADVAIDQVVLRGVADPVAVRREALR